MYRKAYAWILLAKASEKSKKDNRSTEYIEKAVGIYMSLFEDCVKSKKMVVALNCLNMAVYLYRDCSDIRYLALSKNMHRIERYIHDEISSLYRSPPSPLDELEIEVDLQNITLEEALFQYTIVANSPNLEDLYTQAKSLSKSCSVFHRIDNPLIVKHGSILRISSNVDKDKNSILEAQVHCIESIRRAFLVRDRIIHYNQIIGYILRVSKCDLISIIQHSPVVRPGLVDTASDGFERYFKGDMISAFYILTPLLEDILRQGLTICGHDVTTYSSSQRVQEDRTISAFFDSMRAELENVFGADIISDIERVFLSEGGPCLRHGVAHANLNDQVPNNSDSMYGMWLIWRLITLPLAPRWSEIHS